MVDEKKPVDANVVEVDPAVKPVESVVVGDRRNMLGKRLGMLAIALLLLFFAISSYVQSAENGRALDRAARDRSALVRTVEHLTRSNHAQTDLIKQLQDAIRIQNIELRKAGFKVVRVPGSDGSTLFQSSPPQSSHPTPHNSHSPKPKPSPKPSPTPTPTKSPNPTPITKVKDRICRLTGICAIDFTISIRF